MTYAESLAPGPNSDHASGQAPTYETTVAGWAATLDPVNYERCVLSDGTSGTTFRLPQHLAAVTHSASANLAPAGESHRLAEIYAWTESRVIVSVTIRDDLTLARRLLAEPPDHGPLNPREVPAAVAAVAIIAHHRGHVGLNDDELRWARGLIASCAVAPTTFDNATTTEDTPSPLGVDRSAAAALPALLVLEASTDRGSSPHNELEMALVASATSLSREVRRITATALGFIWNAACAPTTREGSCIHEIALRAIDASIRECRLGLPDASGRRSRVPITGSLLEELDKIPTECLTVPSLVAPIIAAADASVTECCVQTVADDLLCSLILAYRRGAVRWATGGYLFSDKDNHYWPAKVMFSLAADREPRLLLDTVRAYADCGRALSQLLHDLSEAATYDPSLRSALPIVWPPVLQTLLNAIDGGADPLSNRDHLNRTLRWRLPPYKGARNAASLDVPRACGDEPTRRLLHAVRLLMYPAPAGTSRRLGVRHISEAMFPAPAGMSPSCWTERHLRPCCW